MCVSNVDSLLVFQDKNEAFKYFKKNRDSRLKCFDTYEQAEHFAKCGLESTIPAEVSIPVFDSNGKQNSDSNRNTNNCDKTTTITTPKGIVKKYFISMPNAKIATISLLFIIYF